ncbi:putative metal-dependent hydrolase related to alanyl-tRNA synthetase HxxxH domain protein [Methanomethylovorans hollandica DSM 15978]|uniref:Putative metal-dependent hydrolase related to alanyl-tRNA synthetase HxxxH domain protein n=1 Tax=Methanomethylovorans hollandica (strain DSM 15978 / NBRC 107637 / DMS1) TaxID=867904 RepID=L0KYU2_METHD|nr:alanyl-tRNA editing protein AlaXM [Methanomethylovorans hollandica]AGB49840.1 putative metal-dependent hydrolase related to alanyl-tRNA synthetase HxxxH domain protein [Methanomethylovorans hollandica DSM 15978]
MEELYFDDCYLKEFDAVVENVVDERYIVLDRTAFYPEAGGQPHDIGFLYCAGKEYPVTGVRKADGKVYHEIGKAGLNDGDVVRGVIDWDRRYLLMRYHTACHILSSIIHSETGAKISGNQLSEDKTRVDFSLEEFDREQLKAYEVKVNDVIDRNIPVTIETMDREEAFGIPSVVKLKDAFPPEVLNIRVITIPGVDRQACGGTHVASTGEIPHIEIFKAENKGKNNRRVYLRFR